MALHSNNAAMLKESLIEMLHVAEYCVDYRKTDDKWAPFNTDGCLGFPGCLLLFSIVDTIGSFYRGNRAFQIVIDDNSTWINGEGMRHFYILNSIYFNQELTKKHIKILYEKFRSLLTHNSSLGTNCLLQTNSPSGNAFAFQADERGETFYVIFLRQFLDLCKIAVDKFMLIVDDVVPSSRQGRNYNFDLDILKHKNTTDVSTPHSGYFRLPIDFTSHQSLDTHQVFLTLFVRNVIRNMRSRFPMGKTYVRIAG